MSAHTPVHDKWLSDGAPRTETSVLESAARAGVSQMIVIGTTLEDSEAAVRFAQAHENVWASIGIHPHEAKRYATTQKSRSVGLSSGEHKLVVAPEVVGRFGELVLEPKVVAIGECGLDYFYSHSPKPEQETILRFQLELALRHDVPLSFHVRDAFDDFWPIFDDYPGVRGVLHSFTDSQANMERAVEQGLYIGVNGIATFTKDPVQLVIYRTIPQQSLLLETDAPFLTPKPFRGTICEPKHVLQTAQFLTELRGEDMTALAKACSTNAKRLFLPDSI